MLHRSSFCRSRRRRFFIAYVHWIYTGKLDMTLIIESPAGPGCTLRPPSYFNLAKAWIAGNYSRNDGFCDTVVDRILKKLDCLPALKISSSTLSATWEGRAKGSIICRLFIDVSLARCDGTWFMKHYETMPEGIVKEMASKFAAGQRKGGTLCMRKVRRGVKAERNKVVTWR